MSVEHAVSELKRIGEYYANGRIAEHTDTLVSRIIELDPAFAERIKTDPNTVYLILNVRSHNGRYLSERKDVGYEWGEEPSRFLTHDTEADARERISLGGIAGLRMEECHITKATRRTAQ